MFSAKKNSMTRHIFEQSGENEINIRYHLKSIKMLKQEMSVVTFAELWEITRNP